MEGAVAHTADVQGSAGPTSDLADSDKTDRNATKLKTVGDEYLPPPLSYPTDGGDASRDDKEGQKDPSGSNTGGDKAGDGTVPPAPGPGPGLDDGKGKRGDDKERDGDYSQEDGASAYGFLLNFKQIKQDYAVPDGSSPYGSMTFGPNLLEGVLENGSNEFYWGTRQNPVDWPKEGFSIFDTAWSKEEVANGEMVGVEFMQRSYYPKGSSKVDQGAITVLKEQERDENGQATGKYKYTVLQADKSVVSILYQLVEDLSAFLHRYPSDDEKIEANNQYNLSAYRYLLDAVQKFFR